MVVSDELAQRAKDLLNDETILEVFEILEHRYISNIRGSHVNAKIQREEAFFMLRAVDELKQQLATLAVEPKVVAFRRKRSSFDPPHI